MSDCEKKTQMHASEWYNAKVRWTPKLFWFVCCVRALLSVPNIILSDKQNLIKTLRRKYFKWKCLFVCCAALNLCVPSPDCTLNPPSCPQQPSHTRRTFSLLCLSALIAAWTERNELYFYWKINTVDGIVFISYSNGWLDSSIECAWVTSLPSYMYVCNAVTVDGNKKISQTINFHFYAVYVRKHSDYLHVTSPRKYNRLNILTIIQ